MTTQTHNHPPYRDDCRCNCPPQPTERSDLVFVQCFKTKNDINGNSRRVWLSYGSKGEITRVHREHYNRPEWSRVVPELPTITVAPMEFRRISNFCQ